MERQEKTAPGGRSPGTGTPRKTTTREFSESQYNITILIALSKRDGSERLIEAPASLREKAAKCDSDAGSLAAQVVNLLHWSAYYKDIAALYERKFEV